MKFAFYSATRGYIKDTLFYKSIDNVVGEKYICFDQGNQEGLSKRYNEILKGCKDKFEYIVFVHDDVHLDDDKTMEKLIEAHKEYDIVGLAGGLNPVIQAPALWHLMCGGFQSGNLRGVVGHFKNEKEYFFTHFGNSPSRVAILDGVFLSVKTESIKKSDWKFNENYTFHHYDIASSLDANKLKLKLGVYPIKIIHKSPGLLNPNCKLFTDSQEKFIREYSSR
ncbi:MAG: hypothetical protein EBU90_18230 [Proteobacteria bacterium]|nr:hypothetical protein [Pseudomonadota bacterium]NBP15662.1 hypothetical protein [bacterium]